jgi:hypothetical protein
LMQHEEPNHFSHSQTSLLVSERLSLPIWFHHFIHTPARNSITHDSFSGQLSDQSWDLSRKARFPFFFMSPNRVSLEGSTWNQLQECNSACGTFRAVDAFAAEFSC